MRFLGGFVIGFLIAYFFCGSCSRIYETPKIWGAERAAEAQPSVRIYIVQRGDTLGDIATRHGTTWQKLWELNPQIADPNWIYPGDKIRLDKTKPIPPPLTKEEKLDKLVRLMFKKAVLPYAPKNEIEATMGTNLIILYSHPYLELDNKRRAANAYITLTRRLEIWELAEAIIDQAKDDLELYRLSGLAWQESHFVNKRGRLGERSFFQFLPSTLKYCYGLDDIGLQSMLFNVENDPAFAVKTALELLRGWKWNWQNWNNGVDYEYHLNNKIYAVKREFERR